MLGCRRHPRFGKPARPKEREDQADLKPEQGDSPKSKRPKWLGCLIAIGLTAFGAWVAITVAGITIYLPKRNGYTAISLGGDQNQLHPVTRDRLERILARLIRGDLFDNLWVSRLSAGDQLGLTLSLEGDKVQVDANFLSLKNPGLVASFRDAMKSKGYIPIREHPWNVGEGIDLESITITYRLERKQGDLQKAIDCGLEAAQGQGNGLYVNLWRTDSSVGAAGIHVIAKDDILAKIP